MSKNTALKKLWCHDNQLTALNVSNTELFILSCGGNQLTEAALFDLFETLPYVPEEILSTDIYGNPLWVSCIGWLDLSGNPGESDCDRSIAEEKRWVKWPSKVPKNKEDLPEELY